MADDLMAVADLVANSLDVAVTETSDLLRDAPFFARLPVTESSNGDTHKYTKETGAPVVGFRAENTGREFDSSIDTLVTVTLKILDFSWAVDKAVADSWMRGPADFIAREGMRHLRSAFFEMEEQYLRGTGNDASGFVGFADSTQLDALADTMVLGQGGTTNLTSVYLVREGLDDVVGVMKGDAIDLGETIVQDMNATNSHYPVYYTPGVTWAGLQIGGAYSVARLANFDAGSNSVDDAALAAGIELFPAGRPPTVIVMNRRSLRQLRDSRTATNPTGAPAPFPSEAFGIPIVVTDALSNAETAVA